MNFEHLLFKEHCFIVDQSGNLLEDGDTILSQQLLGLLCFYLLHL